MTTSDEERPESVETAEKAEARRRTLHLQWKRWYSAFIVFALMACMFSLNAWYTNYVDEKNRQDWCDLFVFLDSTSRRQPPESPEQQEMVRLIQKQTRDLGCDSR
jgi:hypothetical protein